MGHWRAVAITASTTPISAAETHCTYRLPEVLKRFGERFPRARVLLRPVPTGAFCGDTVRDRAEGRADVAFVLDEPVRAGGLVVEPLVEEPVLVLAAPSHPLARSAAVVPTDLGDEQLLLTGRGCGYRGLFERALLREGVRPREVLEFTGVEAIKQCAMAVLGWPERRFRVLTQMAWHEDRWRSPTTSYFLSVAGEVLEETGVEGAA